MALAALDSKPQHSVVLTVDGEEMTDPKEIMKFIMDNPDMFGGKDAEDSAEGEPMDGAE